MFSFCVLFIFLNWGMQTFTLLSIEEAINEIMFWRFFLRVTQALRAFYKTNCKFVLIKLRLAYSNSGQNGIGMFIVQLGPGQNQSFGPKQNTKFGVLSTTHHQKLLGGFGAQQEAEIWYVGFLQFKEPVHTVLTPASKFF